MKFNDKNILIISPESWGESFVSKHHYAIELSKSNSVYFLNLPSDLSRLQNINKNLTIIEYNKHWRGIRFLPYSLQNAINKHIIDNLLRLCKIDRFDIVWSFDPYRFQNLKIFNTELSIYFAVDVHNTKNEKKITLSADIVFASSDMILKKLVPHKNKFKIGHGISNHFFKTQPTPIQSTNKIKIGYIGNLHYRYLDCEILKTIIIENSDIEFHFYGPYKSGNLSTKEYNNGLIDFLKNTSNTYLYGSVPSEKLPALIKDLDGFLLCYKADKYKAELSNPHKILEYLSTGKVVVSSYIDEYKNKGDLIEMATVNNNLPIIFHKVVKDLMFYNHSELRNKRITFAQKNTYGQKINEIEDLLNNILTPI